MTKLRDGRTVNLESYDPALEGRYNAYVCAEGHTSLSLDVDKGTTPMLLRCRRLGASGECGATAASQWYPKAQPPAALFPVRVVWRAPTRGEVKREKRDGGGLHYALGGLALEWHNP